MGSSQPAVDPRSDAAVERTRTAGSAPPASGAPSLTAQLRRWLVAPLDAATPSDERRSVELVALLSLAMLVTIAIATAELLVTEPVVAREVMPAFAGAFLGNGVAHVLARRGAGRAAGWTIVAVQIATPLALPAMLPMTEVVRLQGAGWVTMGVLTASATLGSRAVLGVGVGATAALTAFWTARDAELGTLGAAGLFVAAMTTTVYVYARHRDGLEADRRSVLEGRNAELEALRASLEDRVRERTAELERAHRTVLDGQQLLLASEKMAAVGRLTAGFAHELATPLSSTASSLDTLETLRAEYADSIGDASVTADDHRAIEAELGQALTLARSANATALRFVKGIRAHTRDPGPQAVERFDASTVATQAVELVAHLARSARIRLEVERSPGVAEVVGVPSRLNQAITNLVGNAIDAVAGTPSGAVTVRVRAGEGHTIVEVEDNGPGIPPDVVARMFEPLFTTKPYGKGTGLGLSIVDEIVRKELGGRIEVRTSPGAGATFTLHLPTGSRGSDGT